MKRCPCCKKQKERKEFFHDRRTADSFTIYCKGCLSKKHQDWAKKNRLKLNIKMKEWRTANPEKCQKYRQKHKQAHSDLYKKWREQNKEYDALRKKTWKKENRDRVRELQKNFSKTPKCAALNARAAHKYRALKVYGLKIIADLTDVQFKEIINRQNNKCNMCQRIFGETLHPVRDCIVPLSKGGNLTLSNVQVLCLSCNSKKRNRSVDVKLVG